MDGSTPSPRSSLDSPDPTRRVRDYYRRVNANGVFYGLIRRSYDTRVEPMRHRLAEDWVRVAALAFMGEVHTVDAGIHRAIPETYDLQVIVRGLGLRGFQAAAPASRDRLSSLHGDSAKSDVYAPTRLRLAACFSLRSALASC